MALFSGADLRLVARHPEVYEPCEDSFALVDAIISDRCFLKDLNPNFCLEVGCGSGYVTASLALLFKLNGGETRSNSVQLFATDINPHATVVTQETLRLHGMEGDVVLTSLVEGFHSRFLNSVDVLVFNPPYVPTPPEEVGVKGIVASWAGGERGREVVDKFLPQAVKLLSNRGAFYLVTLSENDPEEICSIMEKKGFKSVFLLKRLTEEETLYVLKFWRE